MPLKVCKDNEPVIAPLLSYAEWLDLQYRVKSGVAPLFGLKHTMAIQGQIITTRDFDLGVRRKAERADAVPLTDGEQLVLLLYEHEVGITLRSYDTPEPIEESGGMAKGVVMSKSNGAVLLSWVAVNNDPYERERATGDFCRVDGKLVPGPTLTLLCDPDSPYKGIIGQVIFLHRSANDDRRESRALAETVAAVRERCPGVSVSDFAWNGDDPTDHQNIYRFLRKELPTLRERLSGKKLVIHLSPGTPAMHTVWVLMVETGMIAPPVEMVKSYRPGERRDRTAVVPVRLGLDTFFKVYQRQHGGNQPPSTEECVFWDPQMFKSAKLKAVFAEARRARGAALARRTGRRLLPQHAARPVLL